jgi:predicted nucleic acid-binding protein
MNAIDTNILLYSVDPKEVVKKPKAEQLIRHLLVGRDTVVFWQVLAESVRQLRRWKDRGDLTDAEFDLHVQHFRVIFPLLFPKIGVLDQALDLAKKFSLSHWDSMILGACKDAGVTTLYTEDMGSPCNFDGIQLINPVV